MVKVKQQLTHQVPQRAFITSLAKALLKARGKRS